MKPTQENLADILIEDFEPSKEPVKAPTYGNATTSGIYKPNWMPVRPDPSREIQSRGLSC